MNEGSSKRAGHLQEGVGTEKSRRHYQYAYGINDGVNPVQETDGVNVLANILTGLGIDEVFTRTDAAGASNFLADALGSSVALADSAGTLPTDYTYEPFGGTTVAGVSSANSFQYTGRENDGTGLYYHRARYYHPGLQRFISEDPFPGFLTLPQSLNGYPYAFNNPNSFVDPDGKFVFPGPTGAIGGAIAGGIGGATTGGITGGIGGAIAGGAAGAISGAISGALTGTLGGGTVGTIVGETVGSIVGEALNPSGTMSERSFIPPIPVIKNPPRPPDPFKGQQIQCPLGGCPDMGGRKDGKEN
ncbi:MAG: RHS repeat-associated core domain-containing protein [Candidatus Binatia bacterium]